MNTAVKRAGKWLVVLACGTVLLCAVAWILIHTGPGRSAAADFLSSMLSRAECTVRITGLELSLPGTLGFKNLSICEGPRQLLSIDDALLKWDPWSIFQGRVRVTEVCARSIDISGYPDSAPVKSRQKPDKTDGLPWEFLTRISILSASFEYITIDEAVMGIPASFSFDASLGSSAEREETVFSFDVERLDAPGGHARFKALIDASESTLTVDGHISEPAGGVVSTLAGRPVPVEASVSGAGSLEMWTGSLEGRAGGLGALNLDLSLKKHGEVFGFTGDGKASVLNVITGNSQEDPVRLAFDAGFSSNGDIRVHDLQLNHAGAGFFLKGMVERGSGKINGLFSLDAPDVGGIICRVLPGVKGGLEIKGKLGGTMMDPVLEAEVTGREIWVYDFAAPCVSGEIRTVFHRRNDGGGILDITAQASGTNLLLPGGVSFDGETVSAEADLRLTRSGVLSGGGKASIGSRLLGSFNGSLSSAGRLEAKGYVQTPDLSSFSGLAGVPLAGACRTEFSIRRSTDEPLIVQLEGSAEEALLSRLTQFPWSSGDLRYKGTLKLEGNGELHLEEAVLTAGLLRLSSAGSIFFPEKSFSCGIDLQAADLSYFSSVSGIPLSGRAGFGVNIEGRPGRLKAEARGDLSDVSAGGFRVHKGEIGLKARGWLPDMRGDLSVDLKTGAGAFHLGTAIRSGREQVNFDKIVFNWPAGRADGKVGVNRETMLISGGLEYSIQNPGRFVEGLLEGEAAGSIRFLGDGKEQKSFFRLAGSGVKTTYGSMAGFHAEGEATGLFPPISATAACRLRGLAAGDLRISSAAVEGKLRDGGWSFDLDSKGSFKKAFSSGISVAFSGGPDSVLTVGRLDHVHGGIPVRLDLPARLAIEGSKVRIEQASFSIGQGTLTGSGIFDRDLSNSTLEVSCRRLPLALASALGYDAGEGVVSGKVNISQWKKAPVLNLDFFLEGFRLPGSRENVPALDADLLVSGDGGRIQAEGGLESAGKALLSMSAVFPVEYGRSSILPRLPPGGKIEGRLVCKTDIKDAQAFGLSIPGDLSGKAELKVDVRGTAAVPQVDCGFSVKEGTYRHAEMGSVIENVGMNFSARTSVDSLALRGLVSGISPSPCEFFAELPVILSLSPLRLALPVERDLKGFLKGCVDLSAVPPAFSLDRHYMQGLMELDLNLAGTMARPLMTGSVHLERGYFEDITTGTVLEDISLDLEADPSGIKIVKGEARAGTEGKVKVEGGLDTDSGAPFSYNVAVEMENAAVLRRDDSSAVVDGPLHLKGTGREASVTGALCVERAEIKIPERMADDIPRLDVVEVHGRRPAEPVKPSEESAGSFPVNLDVRLESPGRLFVSGRGLDSEWKGKVHLEGGSKALEVSGAFTLVRGYFNLLGKRFTLSRGSIQLGGPPGAPAQIDVVGKASSAEMTAEVRVSGPAQSPSISLSSSPSYPSDEIMARLLFGRSLDSLTPLQAVQLAQAAQTLAGGGGLDILARARKLLGVDQLELTQSEEHEGEASIRAGKYINERIYLQLEQGVGSDNSRASVEVELTPNLSLETEIGADSGGGVGIKWRWDY